MKFGMLLAALTLTLSACGTREAGQPGSDTQGFVVHVRIPEKLDPAEVDRQYVGPLGAALEKRAAGQVTGQGTESGLAEEDRTYDDWINVDVTLVDGEAGLVALREELIELEFPETTILDYVPADGLRVLVPLWSD